MLGRPPTPELYPQIGTEYREEGAFAAGERDTGDAGVTEGIAQGRSEGTWGSCPRVDFRERLGGGKQGQCEKFCSPLFAGSDSA